MPSLLVLMLKVALLWQLCEGQDYDDPPPADIGMEEEMTAETMDQLISRALGGIDVAANKMIGPGGMILAELDMLLTEEQFKELYTIPELAEIEMKRNRPEIEMKPYIDPRKKRSADRRQKRKAVRQLDLRWHNREVPYRFAHGHFNAREKYFLKVAMREWEKYTCIMFREATSGDPNVLVFQNGDGCNSQLGMVGGVQVLNLDINGCRWKGLYLHEIGHAIGLVHEHQLPNRDDFIEVLCGNVAPSMRIWFNKYNNRQVNQDDVDYEYTSVMHYGITAFSTDGKKQTIKAKNQSLESTIGKVWKKELSFSDVKSVNLLYKCGSHCPANVRCKDGGYVDQNCKCVCPDGSSKCQVERNDKGKPSLVDDSCFNKHSSWQCYNWASQGECERNPEYMRRECKKSCLMCDSDDSELDGNHVATWAWQWLGVFANLFPKKWTVGECIDLYSERKCQHWEENGDCVTAKTWMTKNCKKTCNRCNVTTPEENCENKYNSTKCDGWAKKGECIINKAWMVRNCRKSCLKCVEEPENRDRNRGRDTNTIDVDDRNNDRTNDRDDSHVECVDKHHDSEQCQKWANRGECRNNPQWMTPNCRRSCNRCGRPKCIDEYGNTTMCQRWAGKGECRVNKAWMIPNCRRSCQACVDGTDDRGRDRNDERGRDRTTTIRPITRSTARTTTVTTASNKDNNSGRDTSRDTGTRNRDDSNESEVDSGNTHTSDRECDTWARHGHCNINPRWMMKHCAGSCKRVSTGEEDIDDGYDVHSDLTTTAKPLPCEDENPYCRYWLADGYCEKNVSVLKMCRKSCNNCQTGCRDKNVFCRVWGKKISECYRNPTYMFEYCPKTCQIC